MILFTPNKGHKGFTLVELLLAVFILSVSIAGVLLLFTQSILSTEYAWDKTVATSHAEGVLEQMQLRETLSEIAVADWVGWAEQQGFNTLPNETIQIVFANAKADPLDIQVTVNWVRKQRNSQVTLRTQMTK
jgi:prepilin-type N-terminal cleavage/methylation domain-containing protein